VKILKNCALVWFLVFIGNTIGAWLFGKFPYDWAIPTANGAVLGYLVGTGWFSGNHKAKELGIE